MKLGLQIVLGILSLIPGIFGLYNIWIGAARYVSADQLIPELDNQFRYQSGVYFGIAVLIWWLIPRIEKEVAVFRIVIFAVFFGGLARVFSILNVGMPEPAMIGGMILELSVPLLIIWQNKVRIR